MAGRSVYGHEPLGSVKVNPANSLISSATISVSKKYLLFYVRRRHYLSSSAPKGGKRQCIER